jgi:hypothetical protein
VQIPLIRSDPLEPLPIDSGHYVVAIQNKPGELDALRHASDGAWERMTPLVHIVGNKNRSRDLKPNTVSEWVKKVAGAVGFHPVYLDVMRLTPTRPVHMRRSDVPVLERIYECARRRQMRFVPVVWAGRSSDRHVALARDAALQDGHGLALRVRILEVVPSVQLKWGGYLAPRVDDIVRAGIDVDLLIDLEYLKPDFELSAADLAPMLQDLIEAGPWRAVVLLGTSVPATMGSIREGTMGSLPRREWQLWLELGKCDLQRTPCFGDYAVQHPHPPQEGGGPGMRANIRYTCHGSTLIARGTGWVAQEGNAQYALLCKQLVDSGDFAGATYSWGDSLIDQCSRGVMEPGAQDMWRGAGTSHHIEFVTNQLRQRLIER